MSVFFQFSVINFEHASKLFVFLAHVLYEMNYMNQKRDYYEDYNVLTPYCQSACHNFMPPPAYPDYSNYCENLPCVIRTIYKRPVYVPHCVITPYNNVCAPYSFCKSCCQCTCEPVRHYNAQKKEELNSSTQEDDYSEKVELPGHWIFGIVLLATFVFLIFNFNQQLMAPCKQRFFM